MSESISINDKLKYLVETDRQVLVNIQFADRKASIYLTITGAILAFLVRSYPLASLSLDDESLRSVGKLVVLIFAYASTILAIVFLSCVIWPRGFRGQIISGYFDPNRIRTFCSAECYSTAYLSACDNKLIEQMCELLLHRSHTDAKKYKWLKHGMRLSYVTWALVAATFLTSPPWSSLVPDVPASPAGAAGKL